MHFVKSETGNWTLTDYTQPDDVIRIETIGFVARLDAFYRAVALEEDAAF